MSNNLVSLHGRIVNDVEVQTASTGNLYGRMAVAVYAATDAKNDEGKPGSGFFDVKFFGDVAKKLQETSKGTPVTVFGRLMQSKYTDKEGVSKTSIYVVADNVVLGQSNPSSGSSNTTPAAKAAPAPASKSKKKDEDDPFADE